MNAPHSRNAFLFRPVRRYGGEAPGEHMYKYSQCFAASFAVDLSAFVDTSAGRNGPSLRPIAKSLLDFSMLRLSAFE